MKEQVIENVLLVDKTDGVIYEPGKDVNVVLKGKRERVERPIVVRDKFVKLSEQATKRMVKELTPTEITMVIGLVPYVSYEDCVLRKGGHGNGEVMSVGDIAKELGIEERKAYRLIASLEKKGVMGHHVTGSILKGYDGKKNKVYTVNPFVYRRGAGVNRVVYEFYRKSGWREMSDIE